MAQRRRHLLSFVGGIDPKASSPDDVVALVEARQTAERQVRALAAQLRRTEAELQALRHALKTSCKVMLPYVINDLK